MKSYIDLKQSKKLAEILSKESADQTWERIAIVGANLDVPEEMEYWHNGNIPYILNRRIGIPCWSLAALLDHLEDVIYDEDGHEYQLQIIKEGVQYHLVYEGVDYAAYYDTPLFDDLIDACYEMILKLHEEKIIIVMDYKEKVIALLNSKELSQEQKEKLENIFPELKESEDERIKKDIISYLRNEKIVKRYISDIEVDKWIAWLEKQGKQTHAELSQQEVTKTSDQELSDKVKPKFKVGDCIVINETTYQITEINDSHVVLSLNGRECNFGLDVLDNARLWTITDAKDGDVLAIAKEVINEQKNRDESESNQDR